jgi:C1q domain
MAIIFPNGSIEADSSTFRIKNSAETNIFEQGVTTYSGQNFGYYLSNQRPGFVAGRTSDPGWVTITNSAYSKVNDYCINTSYNKGSCYDTTNTRFTCPVSGPYFFVFSTYMYTATYAHPVFAVNGNISLRRPNAIVRMRGHGFVANYQQDMQMEEVINCVAGDYVEAYSYSGGATTYHYPNYSLFMGVYVG